MAVKGSLIKLLLRIVTPEEINELTSTSSTGSRESLTSLIEEKIIKPIVEEKAKIIRLKDHQASSEQDSQIKETSEITLQVGPLVHKLFQDNLTLFRKRSFSEEDKLETSVFIIQEKMRFEKSKKKIKEKEIINLYAKNSKVDVESEKALEGDFGKSTQFGVLINKKQA